MVQQANDIHPALRFFLEVTSCAWPHALVAHEGPLAQQLDSVQIHVLAVQHQLDFAKGPLSQCAHNNVLVHKCDTLQTAVCCDLMFLANMLCNLSGKTVVIAR